MKSNDPTARWRDAERRLYPLIMSAPELYELSITLTRNVVEELKAVDSEEALISAFSDRDQILGRASAKARIDLSNIDQEAVAGAAFALRHSELESEATRAAALHQLLKARDEGRTFATLFESGRRGSGGEIIPPYHRIDACLLSSWGLHASAQFDLDLNATVYTVEAVRIDLASARWWIEENPPFATQRHEDERSWALSIAERSEFLARG